MIPINKKKTTNVDHHTFDEVLDEDKKRRALSEERRLSDGDDGDKPTGGHINSPGKDDLASTTTSVNTPIEESQNQSPKQTPSSYESLSQNKSSPSHDKNTTLPNKTPSPLRVQTQSIRPDIQSTMSMQKKAMSRRDSVSSDDKIVRAAATAAAVIVKTPTTTTITATTASTISELDDSMQGYADDFDDDEGWDTIHE